jgi:hypothetical protein
MARSTARGRRAAKVVVAASLAAAGCRTVHDPSSATKDIPVQGFSAPGTAYFSLNDNPVRMFSCLVSKPEAQREIEVPRDVGGLMAPSGAAYSARGAASPVMGAANAATAAGDHLSIELITSTADLLAKLNASAQASASFPVLPIEPIKARAELIRSGRSVTDSVYLLVSVRRHGATTDVSDQVISPERAWMFADKSDIPPEKEKFRLAYFLRTCGDHFVYSQQKGREFYGVVQIDSSALESSNKLGAGAEGGYRGQFQLGANLSAEKLDEALKSGFTGKMEMIRIGGSGVARSNFPGSRADTLPGARAPTPPPPTRPSPAADAAEAAAAAPGGPTPTAPAPGATPPAQPDPALVERDRAEDDRCFTGINPFDKAGRAEIAKKAFECLLKRAEAFARDPSGDDAIIALTASPYSRALDVQSKVWQIGGYSDAAEAVLSKIEDLSQELPKLKTALADLEHSLALRDAVFTKTVADAKALLGRVQTFREGCFTAQHDAEIAADPKRNPCDKNESARLIADIDGMLRAIDAAARRRDQCTYIHNAALTLKDAKKWCYDQGGRLAAAGDPKLPEERQYGTAVGEIQWVYENSGQTDSCIWGETSRDAHTAIVYDLTSRGWRGTPPYPTREAIDTRACWSLCRRDCADQR